MKKVFTVLILFASIISKGQVLREKKLIVDDRFYLPVRDTGFLPTRPGSVVCLPGDSLLYTFNGKKWISLTSVDTTCQTLLESDTIVFNGSLGISARVTLSGNRTLAFSNFKNGMFLSLLVTQDATGNRALILPPCKVIGGGAGAVTLTPDADAQDILTFWKINNVIYCNHGKNYN